tara:strand:+ start:403 stop:1152 length:750 start_codon:yes stop_codon:yes gene_type:complete
MADMPPKVQSTMSLGSAGFNHTLMMGQEAAKNGDGLDVSYMQDEEDDRREDIDQDFPQKTALFDPQATQMDDECEGEDEEDADALKEEIAHKYATLNIKTYRMRELMGQKMKAGEAGSPYEMLDAMRSSIEEQEAGEQQTYDAQVFNAICAIFQETRKNEDLRGFVAGLFSSQDEYYKAKVVKRTAGKELAILQELYNEQELEHEMAKLKERQDARMAALAAKSVAQAQRQAEKALAKDSEPSKKKAKA